MLVVVQSLIIVENDKVSPEVCTGTEALLLPDFIIQHNLKAPTDLPQSQQSSAEPVLPALCEQLIHINTD